MNANIEAIATKEQELKTLKRIKAMVEALGPQSYLAAAFAGCWEDAESNIENDFANSMKERYDAARRDAEHLQETNRKLQEELDAKNEKIYSLLAATVSPDDLTDCIHLVKCEVEQRRQSAAAAAQRIVELAGEPNSREFAQAVVEHRAAERDMNYYEALRERLMAPTLD